MTVITVTWIRLVDPQWGAGWWHRQTLDKDALVCGITLTATAGILLETLISIRDTTLGFGPCCPRCLVNEPWGAA